MPADKDNIDEQTPDWGQTLLAFTIVDSLSPVSLHQESLPTEKHDRIQSDKYKVRVASSKETQRSAVFLVEKMYRWRGYIKDEETIKLAPKEEASFITLLVFGKDNRPVGTATINFGDPQGMIQADDLYHEELETMRREGKTIMELTKFAMERHGGGSMRIIASLMNMIYIYGKIYGYDHTVIEVNPRHVAFYQSKFGFRQIGPERTCQRVQAPAILLVLDWRYIGQQVRKFGGRKNDEAAGDNLYRYFLSERDEAGLIQRLRDDSDEGKALKPA